VHATQHGNSGRLALDVLLPRPDNTELGMVGGPGKEFWVFGQNHANDVEPQRLARSSVEPGAWRLELSPKAPAAEDLFLTVMQVSDRAQTARWPVRLLEAGERVGCAIDGPEITWALLSRRDSRHSADSVRFNLTGQSPCRILVTDLAAGPWHVRHGAGGPTQVIEVSATSGAAWFTGPAGAWELTPDNER
jgi:heparin/heparan-sulfate lyase